MGHDILIVDDERDICTLIAGILEDEGHTARRAHNSSEAVEAVRQRRPALVILDVWLQGSELDGLQLLEVIQREEPPVPVVMISGHGTIDTAVSAIKNGAYDFIEKPFKADRLLLVVDRAIEADRLRRENASLRRRVGGEVTFVGSSSAAASVRNQIEKVAPTGSRVLISGPSGAGKETVARLIHQGSKRAEGPFVMVNCSALPAERLELELRGLYAISRDYWFVFPRASYLVRDDLRVRVGYLAVGGPQESVLGQFRQNDEFVFQVRYSF